MIKLAHSKLSEKKLKYNFDNFFVLLLITLIYKILQK